MTDGWERELDAAVKRIAESKSVALVLPDTPDAAIVGSAAALSSGLRAMAKSVSVLAPPALPFPPARLAARAFGESEEPLREFVISFDLTRSPIKELKYERGENRLNIILSPSGRIRREDVEFRYGNLSYDLVITLGVPSPEAAEASTRSAPELLHEKPILNIDADPANRRYGDLNLVPKTTEETTLPEIVHRLMNSLGVQSADAERSHALLTALLASTNGFSSLTTRPETLRLAADLMSTGADLAVARSALGAMRPLGEDQLLGRAMARARFNAERDILWAVLAPDDFAKTGLTPAAVQGLAGRLTGLMPQAGAVALLWQDVAGGPVRALTTAPRPGRIAGLHPEAEADTRPAMIERGESFVSFAQAEAAIERLLRSPDAVE